MSDAEQTGVNRRTRQVNGRKISIACISTDKVSYKSQLAKVKGTALRKRKHYLTIDPDRVHFFYKRLLQSNFNGLNIFGTMENCLSHE